MRHDLLGVRIDDISSADLRLKVEKWLGEGSGRVVVTPNAEFVVLAQRNQAFRGLLNKSDLALPDAVSLKFALAVLTGEHLVHRIPGVDALSLIAEICRDQHQRLVLFGGASDVATKAAEKLRSAFTQIDVIGYDPGPVAFDGALVIIQPQAIAHLRDLAPSVVAVALGQGKQEFAMDYLKQTLPDVKIWIGVGGSLDMLAGKRPRAPRWTRNVGLEWLWRFAIEPTRWRRTLTATCVFPSLVLRKRLRL